MLLLILQQLNMRIEKSSALVARGLFVWNPSRSTFHHRFRLSNKEGEKRRCCRRCSWLGNSTCFSTASQDDEETSIEVRAIFCAENPGECLPEEIERLTDALQKKREAAHLLEGEKSIATDEIHWKLLQAQLSLNDGFSAEVEESLALQDAMLMDDYKEMLKEDHLHVIDIREEERHHREEVKEDNLADLDVSLPEG